MEKEEHSSTAGAGTTTLEIHPVVLQKIWNDTSRGPAIPLLGIYPEDSPGCNKDTCSTMFITALFIIAKSWKEQMSLNGGMDTKKCGIYTQWSTIQSLKTMN